MGMGQGKEVLSREYSRTHKLLGKEQPVFSICVTFNRFPVEGHRFKSVWAKQFVHGVF